MGCNVHMQHTLQDLIVVEKSVAEYGYHLT